MRADSIGLYVHVPFCVRKCAYCDFASFSATDFPERTEYVEELCREIDSYKERNLTVCTLFFGGGTPSLLTTNEFEKIMLHIREAFTVLPSVEFTLEANPRTLTREKLYRYIACGVNRLSIGLQSIHENELKKLGRIHDYKAFLDSYTLARELGINNINVDLMYGIPEQTADSFDETLRAITSLSPEHISVYGLIIEAGTPFFAERETLALPSEECECDMYYSAAKLLADAGYEHYEISNYAKHGFECLHNLGYWRSCEYIGVGLSAYSYLDGRRFGNTRLPREYLSGVRIESDEVLGKPDIAYEFAMLGLRLSEGFSLSEYRARFGYDFLVGREEFVKRLADEGYLTLTGDRLALTERGFYVSNSILAELL